MAKRSANEGGPSKDESLVREFIAESFEHLSQAEGGLLELESADGSPPPELMNSVFRAIHSIKGTASALGFGKIQELSHVMEGLLMLVRDGEVLFEAKMTGPLLEGVDGLRLLLDHIGGPSQVNVDDRIGRIAALVPARDEVKAPPVPIVRQSQPKFALTEKAYSEKSSFGMKCYVVRVPASTARKKRALKQIVDLARKSGDVLEEEDSAARKGKGKDHFILVASILPPDMLAEAVGVPLGAVSEYVPASRGEAADRGDARPTVETAGDREKSDGRRARPERPPRKKARLTSVTGLLHDAVRVRVDLLDSLMNLAGEMVLCRNEMRLSMRELETPGLHALLRNLNKLTSELQEAIMRTRMQPIGNVFGRFPRLIRDLSAETGKEVDLHVEGSEVELDRSILEALSDPLTHILRNCVDHGIEVPGDREKAGKPSRGQVRVRAAHEAGQVIIIVTDDGRGIDPVLLRRKAVEKGLIDESRTQLMSDQEALDLVFLPGFSSAKRVTSVSGRGVGMDVVKNNVESLGGSVAISSAAGQGTTVRLRLPLTVAIISSLIVTVGPNLFAIPQPSVARIVRVRVGEASRRIGIVGDVPVLRLGEGLLPLVRLADILGIPRRFVHPETGEVLEDRRQRIADRRQTDAPMEPSEDRRRSSKPDRRQHPRGDTIVVVVELDGNRFGLIVDAVHDAEEIVVKPLSVHLRGCRCFAGATIMGDGRIAMILDVGGIAQAAALRFGEIEEEEAKRRSREEEVRDEGDLRSLVLFTNARDERFAFPIQSVSRLEHIRLSEVERVGDREFVDYRGESLQLLRLETLLPVRGFPADQREAYLIIPAGIDHARLMGVVASAVVDALDAPLRLREPAADHPGLVGSAIIRDHLTLVLDMPELLRAAWDNGGVVL
jgi:two-component system chemotaxis sensor kinase CheA